MKDLIFYSPRASLKFRSFADDLTPAELTEVKNNIRLFKAADGGNLQKINAYACKTGIDWTIASGQFPGSGGAKVNFKAAVQVGTATLESAFDRQYLMGILARESRFGQDFPIYVNDNTAIGGFQLIPKETIDEFNNHNKPAINAVDADQRGTAVETPAYKEFCNAAKIAAWNLARNLQYCTFKKLNGIEVGSIAAADEAILFALAMYRKGVAEVTNARKQCLNSGADNTKWENVKSLVSAEARKYVAKVLLYAQSLTMRFYFVAGDTVIKACQANWSAFKSDCSGFVKKVCKDLNVTMSTGQADAIVDYIKANGWTALKDQTSGSTITKTKEQLAKEYADSGYLVIAGLKGADNVPPMNNGHVVVVVSGDMVYSSRDGKYYPLGYWGRLNGVGNQNSGLNNAFNKDSISKVVYAAKKI
ncbi:hypothetical protein LT679_09240 [Mucilaginibacter roseus]|uniref:Peptidase C39-like domain-containing protein n=1 Tax=Mucilaginibacter roseus TaxID=1528868 RepID=A0ABS8U2C3_9SPHI|nr:hypothetical protein [Mucilaginibacter roseus]MCD8740782.1 hypothetical protein [Mucilaginibacter roseus]